MKKVLLILVAICATFFCTSCASAMKINKVVDEYQPHKVDNETQIEFIGFKADAYSLSTTSYSDKVRSEWKAIRDTNALKRIAKTLADKNIAIDKSYNYFGIYSLHDLELYKSEKRYVTFIEVVDNEYVYDISGDVRRRVFAGIGWGLLGYGGLITTQGIIRYNDIVPTNVKYDSRGFPYYEYNKSKDTSGLEVGGVLMGLGALALIPAFIPEKTKTEFNGAYNIYLYDTQNKEMIYKDTATVYSVDTWKGSLPHRKTDLNALHNYYGRKISNAILEKYDEVYRWLATR